MAIIKDFFIDFGTFYRFRKTTSYKNVGIYDYYMSIFNITLNRLSISSIK